MGIIQLIIADTQLVMRRYAITSEFINDQTEEGWERMLREIGEEISRTRLDQDQYTWEELAADILRLTPEQRRQPVRFLEPYDEPAMLGGSQLIVSPDTLLGEDEEVLAEKGEVYVC